jgi:hypothetical protein
MRLVAAIEDSEVARKILACLDLPARAPPLGPAAGESVGGRRDHEPWDGDPPGAFDQTRPDDYE